MKEKRRKKKNKGNIYLTSTHVISVQHASEGRAVLH